MEACLVDFFKSLVQLNADSADLYVFNGHNGLMDKQPGYFWNTSGTQKDVAVIGCVSYDYFADRLKCAGGYPLLTTNSLMAPEAYCIAALIESWANFKPEKEMRDDVSTAYANYQHCTVGAAKTIFKSGW